MSYTASNESISTNQDKSMDLCMNQNSWINMTKPENPDKMSKSKTMKTQDSSGKVPTSEKLTIVTKSFIGKTMPQVLATSALMSFVWSILYLFFLTILTLQAILTFNDYYSHPVNVEVTIETSSQSLEFPAVTLCNNNIVKKTSISRIPKYKELAFLSDFIFQQILPQSNRDEAELRSLGLHECSSESSRWIPGSWVCNGRQDCALGTDEEPKVCQTYQNLNYSQNCLGGFLQCPDESTCASVCDGVLDCVVVPGYDESEDLGCILSYGLTTLTAETLQKNLTSPKYPESYMNNLDKTYLIEAPEDHVIKLTFNKFFIEECDRKTCWCDALTIRDGGPDDRVQFFTFNGTIGMCGQMCEFGDIVSKRNKITLSFSTDVSITHDGWSLSYEAVPLEDAQPHPGYEVASTGSCGYNYNSHHEENYGTNHHSGNMPVISGPTFQALASRWSEVYCH